MGIPMKINRCLAQGIVNLLLLCSLCGAQDRAEVAEAKRKQLYEVAKTYPTHDSAGAKLDEDLARVGQLVPLRKHIDELEKEFAAEIASKVQPYRNLQGTIQYSRDRLSDFEKGMRDYSSSEAIQADADHVRKMLAMSLEYKAPAYFRPENDIARTSQRIARRIQVLESLAPQNEELANAKRIAKELAEETQKTQSQLIGGILEQNELPKDQYRGKDREALLKLVRATWAEKSPKTKIVRTGLIGDQWTRTHKWEVQNKSLIEVDLSRLQGFVLIENDAKTYALRWIQIQKDHVNHDKLEAWLISDPQAKPEPNDQILKSKVK